MLAFFRGPAPDIPSEKQVTSTKLIYQIRFGLDGTYLYAKTFCNFVGTPRDISIEREFWDILKNSEK